MGIYPTIYVIYPLGGIKHGWLEKPEINGGIIHG